MPALSATNLRLGTTTPGKAYLGATLLYGGNEPAPPPYLNTFSSDIAGWTGKNNGGSLTRDTARYPDGALRWTSTSATSAEASVRSAAVTITGSTTYRLSAKMSHSAAGSKGMMVGADIHAAVGGGYLSSAYGAWTSTPAGTTAQTISHDFTTPAGAGHLFISLILFDVTTGTHGYADEVSLTVL